MPLVGFERYLDADDEFAYRPLAGTSSSIRPPSSPGTRNTRPACNTWRPRCASWGHPGASKPSGHVHRLVPASGTGSSTAVRNPAGRLAMLNGVPVAGVAGAGTSSAVAVTTVYVLTSGSGDSYASNGSTSTATRRTGSPRTTTACPGGIGPGGGMADRCPARRLGRPLLATRSGGRRGTASNRRGELRHTRDGERREKLESANKVDRGRPAEHQGGVSQTHRVPKAAGGGPVKRETTHGNLGYTIVTFRAELARV